MNTANIFRRFSLELGDCWPLFVNGENPLVNLLCCAH